MSASAAEFATVPIGENDLLSGFRCGEPELDSFFRTHAFENSRKGFGRTFVLRGTDDSLPSVLGFYTLALGEMDVRGFARLLPRPRRQGLPRYPLPVCVVGRLASDERTRNRGLRIGETLLVDAFERALVISEHGGGVGIVVDAKNERAEAFYRRYDFVALDERPFPRRMFLPMDSVRTACVPRAVAELGGTQPD